MSKISKYLLYEASVQNPHWHARCLPKFHQRLLNKLPRSFREDFCGSGRISCEWIKLSKENTAVGLDIDPKPLHYAMKVNRSILAKEEQSRVKFIRQNVLVPTLEKFDLIGAYNFSFFALHERSDLLQYAKSVYQSLKPTGTFFLDVAGGTGFLNTRQKKQTIFVPGHGKVLQLWEQHEYDPINSINEYAIHFKLSKGVYLNNAFVYRWRIWQIRELREILSEAGFKKSVVYWESNSGISTGSGEFYLAKKAENAYVWVAYVVGIKS